MPVYFSKATGYRDISLTAVCRKEKKLTLNIESEAGFDEIGVNRAAMNYEYQYLKGILPKEKRTLEDFALKLIESIEKYFIDLWDSSKFHLITHSSGMDSRIISYVLAKLRDKGMELGELHFRCHEPEGELFKQVMREQGWRKDQYSVYKENRLSEPDYYTRNFSQNVNGFNRPSIEFWDDILSDEKKENTVYVSGLYGGEVFSYPIFKNRAFTENRHEDLISNTKAIFCGLAKLYNSWHDILLPFASYDYLDTAFRVDKEYFEFSEGEKNRDLMRLKMLELLGNKLPFVVGHEYNLTISKGVAKQMRADYRGSKFYKDFPCYIVKNALPWNVYEYNNIEAVSNSHIDLKLYGLATMYETI